MQNEDWIRDLGLEYTVLFLFCIAFTFCLELIARNPYPPSPWGWGQESREVDNNIINTKLSKETLI